MLDNASLLAGIILAIVTVVGSLYIGASRLAKLELKVDTLWDYVIRRALSEAVSKGLGSFNSPFSINDETRSWFNSLAPDLRTYYHRHGQKMTDKELFMAIDRNFGERIIKEICIPHQLFGGGCLIAAVEIAKSKPTVFSEDFLQLVNGKKKE